MNVNELQEFGLLAARRALPLALSALIALLSLTPLEISELIVATGPMVALSILVFWVLARSQDVPIQSMFLCGLVFDAVGGGPLGLWALSYLVGYTVTRLHTDDLRGTSRFVSMITYLAAGGLASLTAWGTASLYLKGLADPVPLIAGTVISIGFFLLLTSILGSRLAMPTRYMDRIR